MTDQGPRSITTLLESLPGGDRGALAELWDRVQEELRVIAEGKLRRERRPRPMDTTDLVHETFVRVFGKKPADLQNRKHFYCYAAKVMHHILIDDYRKRGPGPPPADATPPFDMPSTTFFGLTECLEKLERVNERWAAVVRLRYLTRRSVRETADYLGVKDRTVESDWQVARAWLHRCVSKGDSRVAVTAKVD